MNIHPEYRNASWAIMVVVTAKLRDFCLPYLEPECQDTHQPWERFDQKLFFIIFRDFTVDGDTWSVIRCNQ